MSEEEWTVPDELFKDVKFYVVGDVDPKVRFWTLAFINCVAIMLTSHTLSFLTGRC